MVVAAALSPGDVAIIDGRPSRILDEPQTMHRGWSLFDELEILVGVTIAQDDDAAPRRVTLRPEHQLVLVGQAEEAA
jgi:hypothetical protein